MKTLRKPKTRKEIAHELGVSYSTFRRWMKKENLELSSGLLLPNEQEEIYKTFFYPGNEKESPHAENKT